MRPAEAVPHIATSLSLFDHQLLLFLMLPHSNPTQPFLPCAPQDIYELKDQIQDVEGRYMQGLKELKVEGLELTACLLLLS